MLTTQSF